MNTETTQEDVTFGELAKQLSIWQWCGIIVGVMFLLMLFGNGGGSGQSSLHRDRNVEAMTIAQEAIRQNLKFPSSARFSEHRYGPLNENEYFYTALVRAENSFGNKVPSSWHVVLAFHPGTTTVSDVISVTQTR